MRRTGGEREEIDENRRNTVEEQGERQKKNRKGRGGGEQEEQEQNMNRWRAGGERQTQNSRRTQGEGGELSAFPSASFSREPRNH